MALKLVTLDIRRRLQLAAQYAQKAFMWAFYPRALLGYVRILGYSGTAKRGESFTMVSRPQMAFLPTKFTARPSDIIIEDIRVGNSSMFLNANGAPYTPGAFDQIEWKSVQPAQDFVVVARLPGHGPSDEDGKVDVGFTVSGPCLDGV